jgi:hypothetical protein
LNPFSSANALYSMSCASSGIFVINSDVFTVYLARNNKELNHGFPRAAKQQPKKLNHGFTLINTDREFLSIRVHPYHCMKKSIISAKIFPRRGAESAEKGQVRKLKFRISSASSAPLREFFS